MHGKNDMDIIDFNIKKCIENGEATLKSSFISLVIFIYSVCIL